MNAARVQQLFDALGLSAQSGAAFGLTAEETQAHLDAFRDAGMMGGDWFLLAVDRETRAAEQRADPLTAAERLRLDARRAVAMAIEEWFTQEALESYDGPVH